LTHDLRAAPYSIPDISLPKNSKYLLITLSVHVHFFNQKTGFLQEIH
jgi:hypothetical protein